MLDRLNADQETGGFKVLQSGLSALVTVHAAILFGHVLIHVRGLREHIEKREIVAATDFKVVEVVRRRDLDAARTEFAVDIFVGDDRNLAVGERELERLADERLVAFVFGVHGHGLVAEERFRTRGCHHDAFGAVGARVADFPEVAVGFLAFNFEIGDCALQLRIPVHETVAAIDETLLVERHEAFDHDLRELFVHREVETVPIDAVTQTAHLLKDGAARVLLPLPNFFVEGFSTDVATVNTLRFELAFDHDLRGNARMVRTREPERVVARHTVIARERIHHGLIEGVPHVQNARDVGRRQLDGEAGLFRVEAGSEVAARLPSRIPAGFNFRRFKALGKFGLFVRHLEVLNKRGGSKDVEAGGMHSSRLVDARPTEKVIYFLTIAHA